MPVLRDSSLLTKKMTIQEIESACDASQPLDFSRHFMEGPELTLQAGFSPFGFPAEVRTNSAEVLSHFAEIWRRFEPRFSAQTIRVDVHVVEGSSTECPPAPSFHTLQQTMVYVADADNYGVIHFGRNQSQVSVSKAALRHKLYLRSFFLEVTAWAHIRTKYMTPVHAGCVALDGRGVLLCGDAGAGKSTLSYACARAGWTYITDDASHLMNDSDDRLVWGPCHKVRFRPATAELFPELRGQELTPRMEGKPSIEMETASLPMVCAPSAQADFLVFLNRRAGGPPELLPYRKDVARYYMRQIHGTPESLPVHHQAIERLLMVPVFELRYSDLDWAIDRLRTLVREGC